MRVGSLFTGAGGLDLAVKMLWPHAELVWWSEVDEAAAASFARRTEAPNLGDITQIDWATVPPVDVVIGGFPCQDLSHAGKRAGLAGERSGLWFHMLEAINVLRPRLVLLENVLGIYSAGGTDDDVDMDRDVLDGRAARPAGALDIVLGSLAESGWNAEWGDYRAVDVGAPHRRARWFCIAYPNDEGLEGRDTGGVPERAGERLAGAGDPPSDLSLLPTPTVVDMGANKTREEWDAWTTAMQDRHGNGNGHGRSLQQEVTTLPTVTSQAAKHGAPTPYEKKRWEEGNSLEHANLWSVAGLSDEKEWGEYGPAIARWEDITGMRAPAPTDEEGRLTPEFTEWMMGWPPGWTVGTRTQRLKMCGNGVVPLQAALAYDQLLERITSV